MARVKFDSNERDQNFQIEYGIERTIEASRDASVDAAVIESSYDLLDESGEIVEGTVQQKCEAIAKPRGLQFSLDGDTVIFRKPRPR